jgi:hypothetical protein
VADLLITQPGWGLCREPFFSGAVEPVQAVDGLQKAITYVDCPQEAYAGRTWSGVGSVSDLCIGFSPAGCTSIRIAATLRYE